MGQLYSFSIYITSRVIPQLFFFQAYSCYYYLDYMTILIIYFWPPRAYPSVSISGFSFDHWFISFLTITHDTIIDARHFGRVAFTPDDDAFTYFHSR